MPQPLTLSIQGMHCGGCVNRVTNALNKLPGLTLHAVEIGSARLDYDPAQLSPQSILDAVNKLGFTASHA